jgi:hypothetical protein
MSELTVYARLAKVKAELHSQPLKKTGKANSTSNSGKTFSRSYFELGDFLPQAIKLFDKHGIVVVMSFGDVLLVEVINVDKPDDRIACSSPISTAVLTGCHPVQNMGAAQTYMRRYAYMSLLDICENDEIDCQVTDVTPAIIPVTPTAIPTTTPAVATVVISDAQVKRLYALAKGNHDSAKAIVTAYGFESAKDITKNKYEAICKEIGVAVGGSNG